MRGQRYRWGAGWCHRPPPPLVRDGLSSLIASFTPLSNHLSSLSKISILWSFPLSSNRLIAESWLFNYWLALITTPPTPKYLGFATNQSEIKKVRYPEDLQSLPIAIDFIFLGYLWPGQLRSHFLPSFYSHPRLLQGHHRVFTGNRWRSAPLKAPNSIIAQDELTTTLSVSSWVIACVAAVGRLLTGWGTLVMLGVRICTSLLYRSRTREKYVCTWWQGEFIMGWTNQLPDNILPPICSVYEPDK